VLCSFVLLIVVASGVCVSFVCLLLVVQWTWIGEWLPTNRRGVARGVYVFVFLRFLKKNIHHITHYHQHRQNNQDPKVVPNLCMVTFTSSIRNWGTKECTGLTQPKLTTMWGAGLSFHRCHAELVVPVDPYTDQVFDGEEGSRAIRFFTHGYDIYTPDKVLVTHDYHTHQSNPVVHTWGGGGRSNNSNNGTDKDNVDHWVWMDDILRARPQVTTFGTPRVNLLLGIGEDDVAKDAATKTAEIQSIRTSRYGLGTKRTLAQVVDFTGIDLQQKKMIANKCGNLHWVPYTESPDYGLGEVLARPLVPPLLSSETIPTVVGALSSSSSSLTQRKMQVAATNNNNSNNSMGGGGGDKFVVVVVGGAIVLAVAALMYQYFRKQWPCARKKKKERHVA
jgi:Glycosyltransferase (GlcNAc)